MYEVDITDFGETTFCETSLPTKTFHIFAISYMHPTNFIQK